MTNVTVGAGMILDRQPNVLAPSKGALERAKPHPHIQRTKVAQDDRVKAYKHKAATVWLTGLPKSGKSTIAFALEKQLVGLGCHALVLDGFDLRQGLSRDLGFTADDRSENSRRAAEIARICTEAGLIVIANFVSPYVTDRTFAREIVGGDRFLEVFVNTPVEVCEQRDPETYAKARSGELKDFTGVTAPYEPPEKPDLLLPNHELNAEQCVAKVVDLLRQRGILT